MFASSFYSRRVHSGLTCSAVFMDTSGFLNLNSCGISGISWISSFYSFTLFWTFVSGAFSSSELTDPDPFSSSGGVYSSFPPFLAASISAASSSYSFTDSSTSFSLSGSTLNKFLTPPLEITDLGLARVNDY